MGFCASWADGIRHQHLYYYLTSVPARQNANEQKNKTSTFTYKFGFGNKQTELEIPNLHKALFVVCNAMTGFKFNILAILFCLIGILGNSQSLKTIDSLENTYQICLNQGQYMLGCTKTFYYQMDSLLNLRYNILLSQCDEKQKKTLATEQFMWFKKRDRQFILNRQKVAKDAKVNNYEDGQDEKTLLLDKNAKFIKRRVVELFKRKVTDYS